MEAFDWLELIWRGGRRLLGAPQRKADESLAASAEVVAAVVFVLLALGAAVGVLLILAG